MLKVKVALPNYRNIHFPETDFLCPNPECGAFIKFYSCCPIVCTRCLHDIPDVGAMQKLKIARLDYYLGGQGET